VEEADATVIFSGAGKPSRGTALTITCCRNAAKPFIVLNAFPAVAADAERLTRFLQENHVAVLNVAGNRESGTPGIYRHVAAVLGRVLLS